MMAGVWRFGRCTGHVGMRGGGRGRGAASSRELVLRVRVCGARENKIWATCGSKGGRGEREKERKWRGEERGIERKGKRVEEKKWKNGESGLGEEKDGEKQ